MVDEDVIFTMVLATNSEMFIKWLLYDRLLGHNDYIKYQDCEYRIEMSHEMPNIEMERESHEIIFTAKPRSETLETPTQPDGSDCKELGFGFMTVLDIAQDKIHIIGFSPDYIEFDEYLTNLAVHIRHIYSPTYVYIKDVENIGDIAATISLQTNPPGRKKDKKYDQAFQMIISGSSRTEAFDWFCKEAGISKPDKGVRDSFKAAMKRRNK